MGEIKFETLLPLLEKSGNKKRFICSFLKRLTQFQLTNCILYLRNERMDCVDSYSLKNDSSRGLMSFTVDDCDLEKIYSQESGKEKAIFRIFYEKDFLGFLSCGDFGNLDFSANLELFLKIASPVFRNFELKERLETEKEVAKTLYQINIDLSLYLELNNILKKIVESLKKIIDYNAIAIYILDKEKKDLKTLYYRGFPKKNVDKLKVKIGQGLVGIVAKTEKPYVSKNIKKESVYVKAREKTKSEIVVPIISKDKVIGILNLESNKLSQYSKKHLRVLNAFASIAAIAIERSILYRERIEKNRIKKELEIAKQIQDRMIPKVFPKNKFFEIFGGSEPAEIVGGDFFDFLKVGESLYFVIADVSGKGVPASLLVSLFKSAFLIIFKKEKSFKEKVEEINSFVHENTERNQFITAIFGKIESDEISLINCGHNYPIIIRKERAYYLKKGNTILGFFKNYKYSSFRVKLSKGDMLFLYTDGLYESIGDIKKDIGLKGVKKFLKKYKDLPLQKMWNSILKDIKRVSNGNLSDDFTILILKRKV